MSILHRYIPIVVLLAGGLLLRPVSAGAQTVIHAYGTFCVGQQNVFVFQGNGTVSSWSITGNYTIISSNSNSVVVVWNSATNGAGVTAFYTGSSGSGTTWYPGGIIIGTSATPTVSISASANNVCAGTPITFTASGTNGGTSPSYQWAVNGSAVSGATGSTYTTSSLTNGQQVSCTMVSNAPCITTSSVNSNVLTMTIIAKQTMTATLAGSTSVCQNSPNVGYSCNVSNGGGTLSYQWLRNGGTVTSNQGTPPANVLAYGPVNNGDVFQCIVTTNGCYTSPAPSNTVTVAVTPPQPFTVGVGPTTGLNYCTGQSITFSASATATPISYQWQQNGSNISGATGSTYTTTVTSLAQLQGIGCFATTSPSGCLSGTSNTGTAANIPFTVNTTVTPSVSISSDVGTNICSGTSVTFTATGVNGGSSPQYQWLLNGNPVSGATSTTWTTSALTNGQQVSCKLTSNVPCATATAVVSNAMTMNVTQTQQMTLTINGPSTICLGGYATFYASAGNAAGNLTFQWLQNGSTVNSNGPGSSGLPANEFQTGAVNPGDVISCKVISNAACYLPATSTGITMSIQQPTAWSAGIEFPTINFCQGSPVTFTAYSSEPAASYQWESNGNYIPGATGSTYQTTATSVADLQAISLLVTTNATCVTSPRATATNASVPFNISQWVTSSVGISASTSAPTIGSPVTFTANSVNPGSTPSYQWQINGQTVSGVSGGTFTNTFTSGSEYQTVSVTMTSDQFCVSNATSSASTQYQLYLPNYEDQNYIRLHEIVTPGVNNWSDIASLPAGSEQMTTVYFDGLERPIQRVKAAAATPNPGAGWGDIVTPFAYDPYNRSTQAFLPYTTTANPGAFEPTAMGDQPQYYVNNYNESPAYGQITFENSPLSRTTNTKAAGSVWSASQGNSITYDLNDATADAVQIWYANDNSGDNPPVNLGAYASNTLFKNTYTDDKGNLVVEFTNNAGQLVLKKEEISKTHSTPHGGWICTYNVYDDKGLLRYIIQPEGVKYLEANGWSFAGTAGQQVLDGLCYRYEYDDRGRLMLKKAPGVEPKQMVYDNRDRVVFTQDGNQNDKASKEWTAILYDVLDRPVLTALYETSATAQQLLSQIPVSNTATALSISAQGVTVSAFNSPLAATDLNNSAVTTVLKYEFYDNYSYPGAKPFRTDFDNGLAYSNGDPISPTQRTLSIPTGKLVRVLETNTFMETTTYYDEKGRPIQVQADNILGGTDASTRQYDFAGKLLSSNTKHTTAGTGYTNYSIVTKNLFDQLGRITSVQKKYGTNGFKTISAYDYDDLGRTKTKHFDPGYTGSGKTELESLAYSYNINNQLTGINKDYALKTSGVYNKWGNFFGLYLGYDNKDGVFAANQLDGHIAGSLWSTQGDDVQRKYDYSYDEAGRITGAAYGEKQNTTDPWSNSAMDFTVSGHNGQIQYDLNGNIQYLLHRGVLLGNTSPQNVDDLQYQYGTSSNVLSAITDNGTLGAANGALGDFQNGSSGNSYQFDGNGNLVVDNNKNIGNLGGADGAKGIHYNYLDKPEQIRIPGKGTMALVYDAEGTMLQRTFTPDGGSAGPTTSYINQFVYQGNNLDYIVFEEGRIRVMQTVSQPSGYDRLTMDGNMDLPGGNRGAYDFFIRDQLGNVRMVLTEETHTGSNTCTMELSREGNEEPIFGQVDANGTPTANNEVAARFPVSSIPGQSSGNGWNDATIQSYVSQIGNKAASTIGPNVLMKVMAGDQVAGQVIYYYQAPVTNSTGGTTLVTDLLGSLASAIGGGGATTGVLHSAASAATVTSHLSGMAPFGAAADPDANNATGNAPKAYLTVLFFDERFNFVGEGSMAYRVQTAGNGAAPLVIPPTRAPKNGYAYIYVSNESDEMVYFDNLQVSNVHGNILEENHYYAHGLKIAAISSRKLAVATEGEVMNRFLYNDKELMDDGGLNWYDYGQRNYDPQIGRFPQADALTDIFPAWSPFQYAGNEPVGNVDLDGMEPGGMPTPGGTFTGNGILWPGGGLGGAGGAGAGLTGLQVAGFYVSGVNLLLKGVTQQGPKLPSVDTRQPGLIAYSEHNDLYQRDNPNKPGDDWNHESNPTNDDERDLEKRMMRLIVDQSRDDPRVQRAAIKMANRFFDNTGGTVEDDDLNEAVEEDENFQGFAKRVMLRYNQALADVGGDPSKVTPIPVGNPAFNNEHNNTDGLGITIHGVSYVEVHLVKFTWTNQKAGEYKLDLRFDLYDVFGLGEADISPGWSPGTWYKFNGGLKAWYKLQHNFNHVPLLTHVNEEEAAKLNWHSAPKKPGK